MKKFILVVLFIGFCDCVDEHTSAVSKNLWIEDENQEIHEKNIIRPCPNFDLKCVRYYFGKNARCSPVYGRVPDPLILPVNTLPLPNSNMTYIAIDLHIYGLNGKVIEFYVNKMTDKVVLAVELHDLTLISPVIFLKYHRKAREPIVKSDLGNVSYRVLTLTSVFSNINDLQLANAETNVFMDDHNPRYNIGPKASWSKDPLVLKSFAQLVEYPNENIREAFIIQAPIFMNLFIQNSICDFGLKVES